MHKFINISKSEIIKIIGQNADHCFRYSSTQWNLPTPETYQQLIETFNLRKWKGFREYEDLRREYEDLRRPFNLPYLITDVLDYSQESHITGKFDHETKKPETLTRMLINVCSRKNDLVVVPFSGSGTECAMAVKENRKTIGFDIKKEYVEMGNRRLQSYLMQKKLF